MSLRLRLMPPANAVVAGWGAARQRSRRASQCMVTAWSSRMFLGCPSLESKEMIDDKASAAARAPRVKHRR